MSKVYSFRLDENNPREAQARAIIDTWVSKGYSLRHKLVDVLIAFQNENYQNNEYGELLEKIEQLIVGAKENRESVEGGEGALTNAFIGSLSKVVKDGLRVE